uniref:TIL domain-containing protein n=1 Tax=Steinernema glaseri TaxID=37863 RepID=A0A1I8AQE3_9BILA
MSRLGCGRYETYEECALCEASCDDPVVECPGPRNCSAPGCYCPQPYVRHNGECVIPVQCPRTTATPTDCPENERFLQCGYCQNTCEKPNKGCVKMCVGPPGCYCVYPFVLDAGKCIHQSQCPKKWE